MNNSAGVLGVARPHSRDGLAFAGIARAHLAHGGCDLYVRHSKISQGADWISIASGSERPLAKAPPLPLAVLTLRLNPDLGAPNT
jgi:hypothetical protein